MAQRQFKQGDTSTWSDRFGNGDDGALTISSDQEYDGANRSCSGTISTTVLTVSSTTGFVAGDLLLIHQTSGTSAGQWELNKVDSVGSGLLNLSYSLIYTYTDSGADQAQVLELKEYTSATVNSGKTWSAPVWDGDIGGLLAFVCDGTTTISGTINASYKGFRRGIRGDKDANLVSGGRGENETEVYSDTRINSDATNVAAAGVGGGGGAGNTGGSTGAIGGGGGGGHAAIGGTGVGSNVAGGAAIGTANLITMSLGGGGGGGGVSPGNPHFFGGHGDRGGGMILIISKTITTTGDITNLGQVGGNYESGDSSGGGGGGAGGAVLLKGQTVALGTSLVRATGGAGGIGGSSKNGGAGSTGRIHVDYSDTVTGTTSPTLDSTLENILSDNATTTSTTTTSTSSSSSTTTTSTSTSTVSTTSTSTSTTTTSTSTTTTSTSTTTTSTSTTTTSTSTTTTIPATPRSFVIDTPVG